MELKDVLQFKGKWRTYQARVLGNADRYLSDGHIHIVAAPGSGKTTLGIELVQRLSEPVLVLAPTVTIREQWQSRIEEGFLNDGVNIGDIVSRNFKKPSLITVATYQALHSAMTGFKGTLREDAEGDEDEVRQEDVDFQTFDLVAVMKNTGVKVLCLDECHHLRSEWWKALEQFRQEMGNLTIVALTATPPYDSTPAQWKRYIDMCGEVDEEITIPELVRDGSLCPHQDYVYFNYPTKEETAAVEEYISRAGAMQKALMQDAGLLTAVRGHAVFNGQMAVDEILEEPSYLSSMLIYLQAENVPVPHEYRRILGAKKLPEMDTYWMEILLQKLLYDDTEHFDATPEFVEKLTEKLKLFGLIEKRRVTLQNKSSVEKMMITSAGKMQSILDIASHEYDHMGQNLRMLILTDYIRKESERALGDEGIAVDKLGVLPFFEQLRRSFAGVSEAKRPALGVLCGSTVIIPATAKDALRKASGNNSITFSSVGKLSDDEYVKVCAAGDSHFLTAAVTEIFAGGYIHILVGTKSLLGEGWDSPCINSLILASFVGSYMLSNQMRGRAIRVMKDNPDKTSNIWHLVCLYPEVVYGDIGEQVSTALSEDYMLLERRMEHFLGLNYAEDVIENGIERLTCVKPPFNKAKVQKINKKMLGMSDRRDILKERWQRALEVRDKVEVIKETKVKEERLSVPVIFDAIRNTVIAAIIQAAGFVVNSIGGDSGMIGFTAMLICMAAVSLVMLFVNVPKIFMLCSPYRRIKHIGKGILKALKETGMIEEERCRVVACSDAVSHSIYLDGGSGRDKELFAKCVADFYAPVENQRYLVVKSRRHKGINGYFCVPDVFSDKKDKAECFLSCVRPYIGKYELVYTRNEAGRRVLLAGRIKALANRQERCVTREKVLSALE